MEQHYVNAEAARESGEQLGFSFGENWAKYLARIDDTMIRDATESLEAAFAGHALAGRSFLDLGSGSGLFSYAAHFLGASVTSVDLDPHSLECTTAMRERAGNPTTWTIVQGSVLDSGFVASLRPAERVYCWGVLHHTGAMWRATSAALRLIAPGGLGCIAIYNRPHRLRMQIGLKRLYNRLPGRVAKPAMVRAYGSALCVGLLARGRNPLRYIREYGNRSRGMTFWRDVEDWLGGLPFEFAEPPEVSSFVQQAGLAMVSTVIRASGANNEYLISRPPGAHNGAS